MVKEIIKIIVPKSVLEHFKLSLRKKAIDRQTIEETFERIEWNSKESISGEGSEISVTQHLIKGLERVIDSYNIKSILDIPCGDFNWMKQTDLKEVAYLGADIVKPIITENNKKYKDNNTAFIQLDLTKDTLPYADLIFCRDCMVHLSYKDIYLALRNIKRSKSKYVLLTSFVKTEENTNIITGEWRKLNFEKSPFSLAAPIGIIDEKYHKKEMKYSDKSMCLWEISKIEITLKLKLYYWLSHII